MLFIAFSLTGCFYPQENRVENQIPYPDQIAMVQKSVDDFQVKTGVLPILTKEADTPIYQKYVIDFKQLIPAYLSSVPANAFEEGGVFQYVLVNVEEQPEVKLIDLRMAAKITELQLRINEYLRKNQYLPVEQIVDNGYFTLDYKELNLKEPPQVKSPYSENYLPLIANQEGRIGVDYRIDLYHVLKNLQLGDVQEGEDIRKILLIDSYIVPAYSFPYYLKNGEPVLTNR